GARRSSARMSYQARILMPPFNVTGRTGACGNTKRSARSPPRTSPGTIGSKSWPSAPRPCSQMTLPVGPGAVSISTVSSAMSRMIVEARLTGNRRRQRDERTTRPTATTAPARGTPRIAHPAVCPAAWLAARAAPGTAARAARHGARGAPGGGVRRQRCLPAGAQTHRAVLPGERRALQDPRRHLAGVWAAVPPLFDREHPAGAARGARAGGSLRQPAGAHLLALGLEAAAVRGLPAGVQRRRHVSDHRLHLRRGAPQLRTRSPADARGTLGRVAHLLAQRAVLARSAGA